MSKLQGRGVPPRRIDEESSSLVGIFVGILVGVWSDWVSGSVVRPAQLAGGRSGRAPAAWSTKFPT